jgi:hypothetical protein
MKTTALAVACMALVQTNTAQTEVQPVLVKCTTHEMCRDVWQDRAVLHQFCTSKEHGPPENGERHSICKTCDDCQFNEDAFDGRCPKKCGKQPCRHFRHATWILPPALPTCLLPHHACCTSTRMLSLMAHSTVSSRRGRQYLEHGGRARRGRGQHRGYGRGGGGGAGSQSNGQHREPAQQIAIRSGYWTSPARCTPCLTARHNTCPPSHPSSDGCLECCTTALSYYYYAVVQ